RQGSGKSLCILLIEHDRNIERLQTLNQSDGFFDDIFVVIDMWRQAFLNIDNHRLGIFAGDTISAIGNHGRHSTLLVRLTLLLKAMLDLSWVFSLLFLFLFSHSLLSGSMKINLINNYEQDTMLDSYYLARAYP